MDSIRRLETELLYGNRNDKPREAIRVLEKQIINKLTKSDKQFKKELDKAVNTDWSPQNEEKYEQYLKTASDLAELCMKNNINKNIVTTWLIEKEKDLSKYYKLGNKCYDPKRYQEITLELILREYILPTAVRLSFKPVTLHMIQRPKVKQVIKVLKTT